ncbi:MAG: PAS domain S-box protein, partial [Verrucomicrobiaceae bacterium]
SDALEQLHVRHPDIVLIDLDAQSLDAAAVLQEIRRDPSLHGTPVIILSGNGTDTALNRGIRQGADDFISQPFNEVELLARVSARLEIARLRRVAEQAQMHASLILESITDGFFTLSSDWKFTYLNPRAERMVNRKRGEVIGKNLWDEFPYLVGTEMHKGLLQAMAEETSLQMRFEGPRTGRWFEMHAYPCALHGLSIYLRDVTSERRAEDALRESEEKYRVLVEVSPQVIWSGRPDGYITYANQRWFDVTGMTMEQTQGYGWTAAVHPDHLERILHIWRESLRSGTLTESEFPIRCAADDSYRWYHFRGIPIRDKEGRIARWMGVAVDVHDRKMAERERERLLNSLQVGDQKKDEFLAMLAHELRNPLAAVGNAVAVLE